MNSLEWKVGILFLTGAMMAGILSLKVSQRISFKGSHSYWFLIEDASGLVPEGLVRTAGIPVGKITDISLEKNQAKVTFSLDSYVKVSKDSFVEVKSNGILGDRHVEVVLVVNSPPLPENSQIKVRSYQSLSMEGALQELSKSLSGFSKLADTLIRAVEHDNATVLGRFLLNLEELSENLNKVVDKNSEKIDSVIDNLQIVTESLRSFLNNKNVAKFQTGLDSATSSLENIDNSLKNLEEFTEKINEGDGTISRLVNEGETADKINTTLDQVNTFLGGGSQFYVHLDFHTEYLSNESAFKSYAGITLQPGLDRQYEIHLIKDSRGSAETKQTLRRDENGEISREVETVIEDKLKFSVLLAKNFYNLSLKGGMIENQTGMAMDLHLFNNKALFAIEAFGIPNLNVKSFLKYSPFKGIYVMGGMEFFERKSNSPFIGFGIILQNEDWKFFSSKVSF